MGQTTSHLGPSISTLGNTLPQVAARMLREASKSHCTICSRCQQSIGSTTIHIHAPQAVPSSLCDINLCFFVEREGAVMYTLSYTSGRAKHAPVMHVSSICTHMHICPPVNKNIKIRETVCIYVHWQLGRAVLNASFRRWSKQASVRVTQLSSIIVPGTSFFVFMIINPP